jgi:glycosyltransferase involved in cell wall biosynthesis
MSHPHFSIVCPSYQGERRLLDLLNAIKSGIGEMPDRFEIIIVIDASTDKSQQVIEKFRNEHLTLQIITHINSQNIGPASSRNEGARISRGEVILFLDDDCRPSQNWFNRAAELWMNAGAATVAIGGLVTPNKSEFFSERYSEVFNSIQPWPLAPAMGNLWQRLSDYYLGANLSNRGIEYFAGANFSIRHDAFSAIGGFPSHLRAGEDIAICKIIRARYGNKSLLYDPDLIMHHEYPSHFSTLVSKKFRYGQLLSRAMAKGELQLALNPGPAIVLTLILGSFLMLKLVGVIHSAWTCFPVIIAITTLYAFFTVSARIKERKFTPKSLGLGIAFFTIEIANNVGFISGLLLRSQEIKKIA